MARHAQDTHFSRFPVDIVFGPVTRQFPALIEEPGYDPGTIGLDFGYRRTL